MAAGIGVLLSMLAPAASFSSSEDAAVRSIQEKYREIRDIQGSFSQVSFLKDLDRKENYAGKFFLKKPDGLRWNYTKPRDEEIYISGNTTWIYKKSDQQAIRTTFSKDSVNQVPLALLNSLGDMQRDFEISMIQDDILELRPKRSIGSMKGILLEISSGDFPVKAFSVLDVHGNMVVITLKDVTVNSGIEESFFIFTAPPGVEVFDLDR